MAELKGDHSEHERFRGHRDSRDLQELIARSPEFAGELGPLLNLAEGMRHVLVPVAPTRVFRDRLRTGLMLAGGRQKKQGLATLVGPEPWRYWWVGAAALGSAVAAGGIVAWLLRTRQRRPVLRT